ncbi:hypothetical protein GCM10027398_13510 [Azotobacter salinestris]
MQLALQRLSRRVVHDEVEPHGSRGDAEIRHRAADSSEGALGKGGDSLLQAQPAARLHQIAGVKADRAALENVCREGRVFGKGRYVLERGEQQEQCEEQASLH